MIRLFCGFDAREAVGFHAFVQSLIGTCSVQVSLIPLSGSQRDGSNAFTYSRFAIPELCNWAGWAIWMDGADMLLRGDVAELGKLCAGKEALKVVKHDYATKHPRKYVGTELETDNEDYPRKNWSSLILWNCGHMAHFTAREQIRNGDGAFLHRFAWLEDSDIGELPVEWNWLADEYGENSEAKLLHWTAGIPGFYHYRDAPHAYEWRAMVRGVTSGLD